MAVNNNCSKRCNYCDTDHPLTSVFWYSLRTSPQCKVYKRDQRNKKRKDPEWAEANREYQKQYVKDNSHIYRQSANEYYYRNREKVIRANGKYAAKRRKNDLNYKLACNLRSRLTRAVRKNTKAGSALKDLGCTLGQLKAHLESQFTEGMTWETYGRTGWHIDHIIPLSAFNLECKDEFKKACHYTNLQPLWHHENSRKSNFIRI